MSDENSKADSVQPIKKLKQKKKLNFQKQKTELIDIQVCNLTYSTIIIYYYCIFSNQFVVISYTTYLFIYYYTSMILCYIDHYYYCGVDMFLMHSQIPFTCLCYVCATMELSA